MQLDNEFLSVNGANLSFRNCAKFSCWKEQMVSLVTLEVHPTDTTGGLGSQVISLIMYILGQV